ncbi:MAG: N-acetyltransferase family protein [Candidatus Dormibacteria bacterium]
MTSVSRDGDHIGDGDAPRVRRASDADSPALAPLMAAYRVFYEQADDEPGAEAYVRARLHRGESVILVAEAAAGVLLGFTQLFPTFSSVAAAPVWILEDLFVVERARGAGVGRALMEAAEAEARAAGVAQLQLATARDNHTAQRLYRAQGYIVDERFLHFEKALSEPGPG